MIELADVFRQFSTDYLDAHGASMLPSHKRVINDVIQCRTEALGGHLYGCDQCDARIYSYHSCKNRNCPKCHTGQTQRWLEKRQSEMLPTPYFHLTVTVPESLRDIFRSNQSDCYNILMKAAGEATIELARNPKYVGGTVGILMVLHTWTQQLIFHPHVHCLVTGGGISDDGNSWHPAKKEFLVPVKALSRLIRGKALMALKNSRPDILWPQDAWKQEWVVHCVHWGEGEQAVLEYLARYTFRIAINNHRILAMDEQTVTFRYKDRKKRRPRQCQLSGEEFMRRFLQHVLPKGFHKIRYFGLWHPAKRNLASKIKIHLNLERTQTEEKREDSDVSGDNSSKSSDKQIEVGAICPECHQGRLLLLQTIPRPATRPP
ncbi:MAG: IS91 family transposase [Magnetococcales bacterium]|nr:IS91 family transposase [Magnetococcales bacterium]